MPSVTEHYHLYAIWLFISVMNVYMVWCINAIQHQYIIKSTC